ncbi:hypothetical protein [Culturomica massiliensis]|uniref:hypothetical protein n=1 Tax=Culturomica massiliensis TaxID=1841857 RepID=UPI0008392B57|nr:hypothetical protein [Culturomica massiliensis]
MKKMLVLLLFVLGMVLSASAYTVAISLSCGKTVMTDYDAVKDPKDMTDFIKVMTEIHCK